MMSTEKPANPSRSGNSLSPDPEAQAMPSEPLAAFLRFFCLVPSRRFALSRGLLKASFRWAEKEQRALLKRQDETQNDTDSSELAAEPTFEHVSVLNDFLDYCTRQGLLSRFERDILIRFKVDGFTHKEIQNRHTVLADQAVRLRVHRIMQRLQDAALSLSTRTEDANHGSRHITSPQVKKSKEGMKHFSLKHSTDLLPISKSRGQLSLDSSRATGEGQ